MQTDPLISVIMPCFNAENSIRDSINSALAQTYRNIELIIIDDGSRDGSVKIIKSLAQSDSRIALLEQGNEGPSAARNAGLRRARGDLIAFLDADDTWAPSCLAELSAPLNSSIRTSLSYCGWQNLWDVGNDQEPYIPPIYEGQDKNLKLFTSCRWPIHAALTRRQCIEKVGGFDEALSSCMDFDLWLKIGTGERIERVAKVLAYYRHHAGAQITKNAVTIANNHLRVQQNFMKMFPERLKMNKRSDIRRAMYEPLRNVAFRYYWQRDLESARPLFKKMIYNGYASITDWKYLLPSFLPLGLHKKLLRLR